MTDVELIRVYLNNPRQPLEIEKRRRLYALADHRFAQGDLSSQLCDLHIDMRSEPYRNALLAHLPIEERVAYKLLS
jgi:hypothetical protein